MNRYHNPAIYRVVMIYILVSGLWIFFSDRLLAILIRDLDLLTQIQTFKGWFFVFASALLLFYLLQRESFGRERAESAFRKTQAGLQQLFINNPTPMWVYDRENLDFLAVNDAALAKYGYTREEILRMSITDIHPPEDVAALIVRTREDQPAFQYSGQWRHITKDRRILIVQVVSHTLEFANRQAVLETAEDVSYSKKVENAYQAAEQKRLAAERQLRLDESRLEALFQLSQMSEESVEKIVDFALKEAANLSGSTQGFLGFIEEEQNNLVLYNWQSGDNRTDPQSSSPKNEPIAEDSVWAKIMNERQPILINREDQAVPGWARPSANGQFGREMIIPVIVGERVVALAGARYKDRPYDEADVRQLSLLMDGVHKIIERNRMLEDLRDSRSRLESAVINLPFEFWMRDQDSRFIMQNEASIQRWGYLVGLCDEDLDLDQDLLNLWQINNQRAFQGEIVRAELVYPGKEHLGPFLNVVAPVRDGDQIRGVLGMNINIAAEKQKERELQTVVTVAAALRKAPSRVAMLPIVLDQVIDLLNIESAMVISIDPNRNGALVDLGRGDWGHLTSQPLPGDEPITNQVLESGEAIWTSDIQNDPSFNSPIFFDGLKSAACVPLVADQHVLGALWVGSQRSLGENDISLLSGITDIAASALHRVRLHEQTELHLQRLTALRAIDLAITASLDLRVTLNILLNQITAQVNVDAADVLLYNSHSQTLEYAAGKGFPSEIVKSTRIRLGELYAGRAALERKLEFIPNLREVEVELNSTLQEVSEGFTSYVAIPLISKGQVKGILELYNLEELEPSLDWLDFLQAIAAQAAIAIDNAELFDQLQRSNIDLTMAYEATIEGWARALELRDRETEGHARRVVDTTMQLVRAAGVKDEDIVHIRRGVLLHDIGKMAIPDHILLKPGPLDDHEWDIMRRHPQYAYEMLSPIPYLRPAMDIPYCHHERWDGSGYPRGLKGEQIPIAARIFSIVDNWDALRSERPYRDPWPESRVIKYLRDQAGKTLDPELVPIFLDIIVDNETPYP